MSDTTIDELLGGRIKLVQPVRGNRAALDPILLAAAVPARAGECVLEIGCGTGAASLALAARVPGVEIIGFDLQADLIVLARESAKLSGLDVRFIVADLLTPPETVVGPFDHVMANPPFFKKGSGNLSPDPARRLANVEGDADLAAWVAFAFDRATKSVTFIHTAERGGELSGLMAAHGADVVLRPLGERRVLAQGQVGGAGAVRTLPQLALHGSDGRFTAAAEAVLRDAKPLQMG